jgi:hypothetical protein
MTVIPTLSRLKEEDSEFEANLGHTVKARLKN